MAVPMLQTLTAGTAAAFELTTADRLRIGTPSDHQGGDLSFVGFDQALTRNINGWDRHGKPVVVFHLAEGMCMYDGDGEPVLELLELRSAGALDIMLPGCWRELYPDRRPGCRELIAEALGVARGQLTGMASFFVSSSVTDSYYDALSRPGLVAGDELLLGARRATRLAVSACPDTGLPGWAPGEVEVELIRGN